MAGSTKNAGLKIVTSPGGPVILTLQYHKFSLVHTELIFGPLSSLAL